MSIKKENKPRLAINCCCYNQVKFIRQALEGFVMQKTNFPFVAYVSDDASTDGTQEIIKEYAEKYPDIIKPILRTVNTGGPDNYMDNYKRIDTEYYANCEGDDYWTDPDKLQIQVDFLDAHPDYAMCSHKHRVIFEDGSGEKDKMGPPPRLERARTIKAFFERNEVSACSVVYRWRFNRTNCKVEDYVPMDVEPGDWFMHLLHLQTGKFKLIPKEMAVYRIHSRGLWYGYYSSGETGDLFWLRNGFKHLRFFEECQKRFGMDTRKKLKNGVKRTLFAALRNHEHEIINNLIQRYSAETMAVLYDLADIALPLINKQGLKTIKREIKRIKLVSLLAFGARKQKYKQKIADLKAACTKIRMLR